MAQPGSGARTLTLTGSNAGANTFAMILGDSSAGATSLTKSGAGQWVLSAANSSILRGHYDLRRQRQHAYPTAASGTNNIASSKSINVGGQRDSSAWPSRRSHKCQLPLALNGTGTQSTSQISVVSDRDGSGCDLQRRDAFRRDQ